MKTGIVLEGGGAKGAFHVGALKALKELGYSFDGFVGTSIGSLNAAIFCIASPETVEKLWLELDSKVVYGNSGIGEMTKSNISINKIINHSEELKELLAKGGLEVEPMLEYINSKIDEDKVRKSGKDFGLVTVNLTDRKVERLMLDDIPYGKLSSYIMASCYLPGFKRILIDGKAFADGGFADNLPFSLLVDKGYDEIILIRNEGVGLSQKPDCSDAYFKEIVPRKSLGKTMDFSHEHISYLINRGYLDCHHAFGTFRGFDYTFSGRFNMIDELLKSLSDEKILDLSKALDLGEMTGTDRLYMYVLPKLAEFLGLKGRPSSNDIILKLFEASMGKMSLEDDKLYDIEEIMIKIKEFTNGEIKKQEDGVKKETDKLMATLEKIKSIFNKEDLVEEVTKIIMK